MGKLSKFTKYSDRRKYIEEKKGISLPGIGGAIGDDEVIRIENIIGGAVIPMGVAGPLRVRGESIDGEFYIPLATTEGALVASISRGCKAILQAGGAGCVATRVGATRGPVFDAGSIGKAHELSSWIKKNERILKQTAEQTSGHLTYQKATVRVVGRYVYVRFVFDTADAMGMNMVTIATTKMAELISDAAGIDCLAVAGNYDLDKKASWLNVISERGFAVNAEVVMPAAILKNTLKTNAQKFFDVWLAKCMTGSAVAGAMGFNAHFANVVAAFYTATGQDLAHVVEGSCGVTSAQIMGEDLYVSVYLPAVMIGTVGGGTSLQTQKEAQKIIGVKTSSELAEILGGAVLAGEISLLSSIAEGSLARAHERLGRSSSKL